MSRSSNALVNLRAVVILVVLAFHSVLPYLAFLPPTPYPFDSPPYRWLAFPVIDSQRWFGFDLFCAWQDLGLMTLMFFLSGLLVPSSLARKGTDKFIADRLLRIGLPFALAVVFLAPLAYYAAYRTTAVDPGPDAYLRHQLALPFWPCGPQWFLAELLAFNVLAAAAYRSMPGWDKRLARMAASACSNPVRFFVVLVTISALAYVPLALVYSPFAWINVGPIGFQLSRPPHYLVYFAAGIAVGAHSLDLCLDRGLDHGLDRGLLDCDGALARHWPAWLAAAFAGFLLWAAPTSLTVTDWDSASLAARFATAIGFVVACASGCLCALSICLRFAHWRRREFDSLSANAYRMYMIHYPFAVWLQYALLSTALLAIAKAAIVFGCTLIASWGIAAAIGNALPMMRLDATTGGARRA
jgi:Acyltransferase family